jgi:hypothetical protein
VTTINYKALGALLSGGRPNPLKLVVSTDRPAHDDAVPRGAVATRMAAPVLMESPPAVVAPPRPVDVLLAGLDAAADDSQRTALLATTTPTVRQELAAALAHRQMTTPPRNAPLDALVAALDGAADDAQRAALLSAASPALRAALADHLFWRNVTAGDAQQQYLAQLGVAG